MDERAEVDLKLREALAATSSELRDAYRNLSSVQARCTELLMKARDWRARIVELGGEDPGPP